MLRLPDESRDAFDKRVHQAAREIEQRYIAQSREAQPETYRGAYEREYEADYRAATRHIHYCNDQTRLNRVKSRYN